MLYELNVRIKSYLRPPLLRELPDEPPLRELPPPYEPPPPYELRELLPLLYELLEELRELLLPYELLDELRELLLLEELLDELRELLLLEDELRLTEDEELRVLLGRLYDELDEPVLLLREV